MGSVEAIFAHRAVVAYAAMQRWFYLGDRRALYRETAEPSAPEAYLWPFSRAFQGTLSLAGVAPALVGTAYPAAVADRQRGLAHYWDRLARQPALDSAVRPWLGLGRGGDKYHDDNVWVALTLVQAYRMGLIDQLRDAAQLFAFGQSGWDTRTTDPAPGGVFWVQQGVGYGTTNHDRGAGASAGNALLGLHLADLSRAPAAEPDTADLLSDAQRMVDWVTRSLSSSDDGTGPFWNAIGADGRIDTNLWSYNQGVMVGAHVLAYRLHGDSGALHQAEAVARRTLTAFRDFRNHPPSFNAMCFQNLFMLSAITSDRALQADILQTVRGYADWSWDADTRARDPATNLFSFDDAGRPTASTSPARLQDQGALVQLYALLAWNPVDYANLG